MSLALSLSPRLQALETRDLLHQHKRKGKVVMIKTRRCKRLVFRFVFCTWNWYDFWGRSWGLSCIKIRHVVKMQMEAAANPFSQGMKSAFSELRPISKAKVPASHLPANSGSDCTKTDNFFKVKSAVNLHGSSGEPLAYAYKRVRFCGVPLRNIKM